MRSNRPIILIILDAFRWDYLNPIDAPFLWNCAQHGLYARKLVTTSGFTQRSALFCGTFPDKSGNFTMFCYDPIHSPFRFLRKYSPVLWLAERIINKKIRGAYRLNLWLRQKYIYQHAQKYAVHPSTAEIPLYLLPLISITEDQKYINKPGSFKVESIFDVFHRVGISYLYLMFPVVNCQDDEVYERTINHIESGKNTIDVYFLQFSDTDFYMHKYGTESILRRKVVGEIDRKIRDIWDVANRERGGATLVIVGDHGMMDVKEYFDVATIVQQEAKAVRLKHSQDYFLFLDSTFARIWKLKNNSAVREFIKRIESRPEMLDRGKFLSLQLAKKYRIPYPDRKYGDLIWWASPGVLIYPDYFHGGWERCKAMHGYESTYDRMKGMAIIYGKPVTKRFIEEAHLIDICPTLCDFLGVPSPRSNEGVSLLNSKR